MPGVEFLVQHLGAQGPSSAATLNQISDAFAGTWNLNETGSEVPESVDFLPYKSNSNPESTANTDGRQEVNETDFAPGGKYRSIVKLFLCYANQEASEPWMIATGWLIAPNLIVTAGQSAYDWSHKMGRLIQVKAYIGYNGKAAAGDPNVQFQQGSRVVTTAEWLRSKGIRGRNVAFIKIEQPFSGVVPIKFEDTPKSGFTSLGVVGYAGDLTDINTGEKGALMYEMFFNASWDLEDSEYTMLEYPFDPYGGNLGSPVLRKDDLVSIGTHVYGGIPGLASVIGLLGNPYQNYVAAFSVEPKQDLQTSTAVTYIRIKTATNELQKPLPSYNNSNLTPLNQNPFGQGFVQSGLSQTGFNPDNLTQNGFTQNGFAPIGFNQSGFAPNGFVSNGIAPYGFAPLGYTPVGFAPTTFAPAAFAPSGFTQKVIAPNGFAQNEFIPGPPLDRSAQKDFTKSSFIDNGYARNDWGVGQIKNPETPKNSSVTDFDGLDNRWNDNQNKTEDTTIIPEAIAQSEPDLAQDDQFFEILKIGIKLSDPNVSEILEVHSPIVLGYVGSAVVALAGSILSAAGKFTMFPSSLVHDFRQGLPCDGIVERAILGEAAFCVVMSMKRRRLEDEGILADMAKVVKQLAPATKRIAPYIMDVLTAPALRIALDLLHNQVDGGPSPDTLVQTYTPSGPVLESDAEAFINRLSTHCVDDDNVGEAFSSVDRIIQVGFRVAGPVLTDIASEGLEFLASSLPEFLSSRGYAAHSHSPYIDGLPERAMLGEAALQALMKVPKARLEEGAFDVMARSIARIGRVVLRSAHGLVEDVGFLTKAILTVPDSSASNEIIDPQTIDNQAVSADAADAQVTKSQAVDLQAVPSKAVNTQIEEPQAVEPQIANAQATGPQVTDSQVPKLRSIDPKTPGSRGNKGFSFANIEKEILDYYHGIDTKVLPQIME